jgi:inner membrane protein
MLFAHPFAGYLVTRPFWKKYQMDFLVPIGIIGSIFPDFDLAYFYLLDGERNLHHEYVTHAPFFYAVLAFLSFFVLYFIPKKKAWRLGALVFFVNVFVHLLLDTVVGSISWLVPFHVGVYRLFTLSYRYGHWVPNLVFHWTFLFELCLISAAIRLMIKDRKPWKKVLLK